MKITIERETAMDALAVVMRCLRAVLAAQPAPVPQAEPVAWYLPSPFVNDSIFRDHRTVVACTGNEWEGFLPLYAAREVLKGASNE
jgi:hypothetical protein